MKKLLIVILFLVLPKFSYSNENQINNAVEICQRDMQQFSESGLSIKDYLSFCNCYMTGMINSLDEKEKAYQSKYQKPSGKFIKKAKKLKKYCTK